MTSPIVNSEPVVSNSGQVPCADDADQAANVTVGSLARANLVNTRTDLNPGGNPGSEAEATVTGATVTAGSNVITATVLNAKANTFCEDGFPHKSASGQIAGLVVNGKPINVGTSPATIPLVLGTLFVNETTGSSNTIIRRAIRVTVPSLGINVVVAEAIADYSGNPCPRPEPRPQCSDGIDNDGDGGIDFGGFHPDSDCFSATDPTEAG